MPRRQHVPPESVLRLHRPARRISTMLPRRLPRAAAIGILGAALGSTSCWLALGLHDRTQAEGSGGGATGDGASSGGAIGDGCFGSPPLVYEGQTNPTDITVDATQVYWIDESDCGQAAVMQLAKVDGGLSPSPALLAGNLPPLHGLRSYGGYAWTVQTSNSVVKPDGGKCNGYSAVMQIPLEGTPMPNLILGSWGFAYLTLAVAGKIVAFSQTNGTNGSILLGDWTTAPHLGGGTPLQDAGMITAIAADEVPVFYWQANGQIWTGAAGSPPACVAVAGQVTSLVAANGWLYWTDAAAGKVRKVSLQGPPSCAADSIVIAEKQPAPQGLAVSGGNVYWVNNIQGGQVLTAPAAASGPVTPTLVYQSPTGTPFGVAADESFVYATIGTDDEVVAVPIVCH